MDGRSPKTPAAILRRLPALPDVAGRLREAAGLLLGAPYLADSLIGGPDQAERLVVRLDGFDCVTFVETALALARATSTTDLRRELQALRYLDARIDYAARLHYFSDWLRVNHRRGAIRLCTRGAGSLSIDKSLSLLAHFPPRRVRLDLVPKRALARARRRLGDAAVVAFASTRAGLDFFHTGLLFSEGDAVSGYRLVHASRSAGRVVTEPIDRFLARNRMRGLAFARPLPPKGPA